MSKELVISANRHETRVAILEDDQVVEVYHQRENEYSLAGSIHKGKVTRVLPGMQSILSYSSLSSKKSETYRNASRSRPISTKADCMPGKTRVTFPLWMLPASEYSFSRWW